MTRMNGFDLFAHITDIRDDLIEDGAITVSSAVVPPARKNGRRLLSGIARFFGSTPGVALLCGVVSLGVLSGIILAGRGGDSPTPGGPPGATDRTIGISSAVQTTEQEPEQTFETSEAVNKTTDISETTAQTPETTVYESQTGYRHTEETPTTTSAPEETIFLETTAETNHPKTEPTPDVDRILAAAEPYTLDDTFEVLQEVAFITGVQIENSVCQRVMRLVIAQSGEDEHNQILYTDVLALDGTVLAHQKLILPNIHARILYQPESAYIGGNIIVTGYIVKREAQQNACTMGGGYSHFWWSDTDLLGGQTLDSVTCIGENKQTYHLLYEDQIDLQIERFRNTLRTVVFQNQNKIESITSDWYVLYADGMLCTPHEAEILDTTAYAEQLDITIDDLVTVYEAWYSKDE